MLTSVNLAWFLFLLLIISAVIMVRYILIQKQSLKELVKAYARVSSGDYQYRMTHLPQGDIGRAGAGFNAMTEEIYQNIKELSDKNTRLNAILKSIPGGLVAVDSEQNIIMMNNTARIMLDIEDSTLFEGRQLTAAVRIPVLRETIQDMIYDASEDYEVVHYGGNSFRLKVDVVRLVENPDIIIGSIINMEDITEIAKLEKMRTDFVANVSHELKTPLTSINGFVETLKNNEEIDAATRNRFLGIIQIESDRLRRLINDILTLSFIESNEKQKEFREVDIIAISKDCMKLVESAAKEKNLTLSLESLQQMLLIESFPDLIFQMILNLLDNGVKYSREGGFVSLSILDQGDKVMISVKDNGIGIPQEDIPRIFERFYRVDKARSKKEGGTGLGLAIVKHIVISLEGTIHVTSELGQGSTFTVTIPKTLDIHRKE